MSEQAVRSWLLGIVVLGLVVRLFEVGEPLIDKQAWRQADTAAIARNYFEEGYELLWPRVDWRGATSGYVELNFPRAVLSKLVEQVSPCRILFWDWSGL